MTTTPPNVYLINPPRIPEVTYSNSPTFDNPLPPYAQHCVWFLKNADIFLSVNGIVYGLRQIHFIQSPLFREILDNQYGHAEALPIPFDKIHPPTLSNLLLILHLARDYESSPKEWGAILKIGKDWKMPHVMAKAVQKLDQHWRRAYPPHMKQGAETMVQVQIHNFVRQ